MNSKAREVSYKILHFFEVTKNRLDLLENDFKLNEILSQQDRKLAKNLINGSVRHLLYLDWITKQLYHGNYKKLLIKTKTILRLAFYELIFVDHIPGHATINEYVTLCKIKIGHAQSKMVNAILRNYLRGMVKEDPQKIIKNNEERLSIQYSFPRWLIKRWISLWGVNESEALCRALNRVPDFDLRINIDIIPIKKFLQLLSESGVEYRQSTLFENRVKVTNIQAVIQNRWFDLGYCSLQDESAAIPVELLNIKSNDIVLDVCSAPGGKLTQILEGNHANITLIAVDIDKSRLIRVRENVSRLKKKNVLFVVADGKYLPFKPLFNKILIDAPCSGLGVIRKHPDIKWRRTMDEILKFSELQKGVLKESSKMLAESGQMAYSTCTLDPLENSNVVKRFLQREPNNFQLIKPGKKFNQFIKNNHIQTLPQRDDMDGAFCALIEKI